MFAKRKEEFTHQIPTDDIHEARCFYVVDLGTQERTWKNNTILQHRCLVAWELLDESYSYEDEDTGETITRRFHIYKEYTLSLNIKANLYNDLVNWRAKEFTPKELDGFHMKKLLNAPCRIVIVHKEKDGKTYANVDSIMKAKGSYPDLESDLVYFSLHPEEFDSEVYEKFSDKMKNKIAESPEFQELTVGKTETEQPKEDDGLPF
jgi:hypothetical protein